MQSTQKEESIEKINTHVKTNVVTPCDIANYSQVHMVPKPKNPKEPWRLTCDYRDINDITTEVGWPLPNISQTMQRIGQHKSKIFAKFDMTHGYFQCPLSTTASMLTAFITFMGIFRWLRVPQGLKGAASHFQRVMSRIVLAGLLYVIYELYIDDILIHAKDDEEFLFRLEEVFKRFQKYNIKLNPDKCEIGLNKIEFLGHLITEEGITFTDTKSSTRT